MIRNYFHICSGDRIEVFNLLKRNPDAVDAVVSMYLGQESIRRGLCNYITDAVFTDNATIPEFHLSVETVPDSYLVTSRNYLEAYASYMEAYRSGLAGIPIRRDMNMEPDLDADEPEYEDHAYLIGYLIRNNRSYSPSAAKSAVKTHIDKVRGRQMDGAENQAMWGLMLWVRSSLGFTEQFRNDNVTTDFEDLLDQI